MPFNGAFDEYDELLDYTLINAGQLEYSRESDQIEMERVSDPFQTLKDTSKVAQFTRHSEPSKILDQDVILPQNIK